MSNRNKKGKSGEVEKPKVEAPKTSASREKTGRRGSRPVKLNEVQKVLISRGGIAHPVLRAKRTLASDFKRRRKLDA